MDQEINILSWYKVGNYKLLQCFQKIFALNIELINPELLREFFFFSMSKVKVVFKSNGWACSQQTLQGEVFVRHRAPRSPAASCTERRHKNLTEFHSPLTLECLITWNNLPKLVSSSTCLLHSPARLRRRRLPRRRGSKRLLTLGLSSEEGSGFFFSKDKAVTIHFPKYFMVYNVYLIQVCSI